MYKTTEKKQYEKPKMKVQPVRAQAPLMACSKGLGLCDDVEVLLDP